MAHLLTCRKEMALARMAENESCRMRRMGRKRQLLGWSVCGSASRLLPKDRIIRIEQQLARARRRDDGEGSLGLVDENASEVHRGDVRVARFAVDGKRRDLALGGIALDDDAAESGPPFPR